MSSENGLIGIFDSGVGGLTILSELKKLLPHESYIYVADSAFRPYGKKTTKELQDRTHKIVQFLVSKGVKLIVVACNTATVEAIDFLRKSFSVPIIGVAPVIKTLAKDTKTKKVAVFATPGTIKSKYLKDLIQEFAPNITVYKEGESGLEHLVENGDIENVYVEPILKKNLLPLTELNVDAIALGCTHYPFLKKQMEKIVGPNIKIIDSGGAVARQTKRVLETNNALSTEKGSKDWYYTTGEADIFTSVVKKLTKEDIHAIHIDL